MSDDVNFRANVVIKASHWHENQSRYGPCYPPLWHSMAEIQSCEQGTHLYSPLSSRRNDSENVPPSAQNNGMVAKGAEPVSRGEADGQRTEPLEAKHEVNGVVAPETAAVAAETAAAPAPSGPPSGPPSDRRDGGDRAATPQPNGWTNHSAGGPPTPAPEPREAKEGPENVVLRRGFVPRTQPERQAQRKSSMTQLQQWVNQRRALGAQDDLRR